MSTIVKVEGLSKSCRLPAFQFYPSDFLSDVAVRAVSVGARGLWIDLLCLLFESPTRYKLDLPTHIDEATAISRMTGVSRKLVVKYLRELETAHVFVRDETGSIYSKRMKRDEEIRVLRKEAGKLGGNPLLVKQEDKQTPSKS